MFSLFYFQLILSFLNLNLLKDLFFFLAKTNLIYLNDHQLIHLINKPDLKLSIMKIMVRITVFIYFGLILQIKLIILWLNIRVLILYLIKCQIIRLLILWINLARDLMNYKFLILLDFLFNFIIIVLLDFLIIQSMIG